MVRELGLASCPKHLTLRLHLSIFIDYQLTILVLS